MGGYFQSKNDFLTKLALWFRTRAIESNKHHSFNYKVQSVWWSDQIVFKIRLPSYLFLILNISFFLWFDSNTGNTCKIAFICCAVRAHVCVKYKNRSIICSCLFIVAIMTTKLYWRSIANPVFVMSIIKGVFAERLKNVSTNQIGLSRRTWDCFERNSKP